jgi:hypothetical protein
MGCGGRWGCGRCEGRRAELGLLAELAEFAGLAR